MQTHTISLCTNLCRIEAKRFFWKPYNLTQLELRSKKIFNAVNNDLAATLTTVQFMLLIFASVAPVIR